MMKKGLFLILAICFGGQSLFGQFDLSHLKYFVGSGTDTTMLVIDFKDAAFDSSYAWGYIYSGSKTGEDMLNAIWSADINLHINIDTASFGNFLQDVTYILHEGLGGMPDFWSSWEGQDLSSLSTNGGIASTLIPGGVFGVSYTDFNPAIAPGLPLPAYDPGALSFDMIDDWVGSGSDSAVMIIDFNDSTEMTSYAFGYLFNDSVSYLQVLQDLDQADTALTVSISGAVFSIDYMGLSRTVRALADWYVWEAENFGNWRLRYIDDVYLHPGDLGAVVYTWLLKPTRPVIPVNINQSIGVPDYTPTLLNIFPNPAEDYIQITGSFKEFALFNSSGQMIRRGCESRISLAALNRGVYILELRLADGSIISETILRQ